MYCLFEDAVKEKGDAEAIWSHGGSLTYSQAYARVHQYAQWFLSQGVGPGELVIFYMANSPDFICAWLGLVAIGAAPALVNTNLASKALVHCVQIAKAKLVLADGDEQMLNRLDGVRPNLEATGHQIVKLKDVRQHIFGLEPIRPAGELRNTIRITSPMALAYTRHVFLHSPSLLIPTPAFALAESQPFVLPRLTHLQWNHRPAQSSHLSHDCWLRICSSSMFPNLKLSALSLARAGTNSTQKRKGYNPVKGSGQRCYNCMPYYHLTGGLTAMQALAVRIFNPSKFRHTSSILRRILSHLLFPLLRCPSGSHSLSPLVSNPYSQTGDTLCIAPKFHASTFWADVRASHATYFIYVGEVIRYLLAQPPSALDRAHGVHAIFGNGLRADAWEPFRSRFGITTVHEFYNSTEMMLGLSNANRGGFTAGSLGVHGALLRYMFRDWYAAAAVDAETGELERDPRTGLARRVPLGEGGEVLVRVEPSSGVLGRDFRGYWDDEEATRRKIARDVFRRGDCYYRTGDALRRDADGRWFFCDRLGDTFRWKGENVSTTEVADALGAFPGVVEASVYGVQLPGHEGRAGAVALLVEESKRAGFDFEGFLRYVLTPLRLDFVGWPRGADPRIADTAGRGSPSMPSPSSSASPAPPIAPATTSRTRCHSRPRASTRTRYQTATLSTGSSATARAIRTSRSPGRTGKWYRRARPGCDRASHQCCRSSTCSFLSRGPPVKLGGTSESLRWRACQRSEGTVALLTISTCQPTRRPACPCALDICRSVSSSHSH